MTPRHATASRRLEARIASQSRKACLRAYITLLTVAAVITGAYTAYVLTSGGPS